jgi:hypothetical protein
MSINGQTDKLFHLQTINVGAMGDLQVLLIYGGNTYLIPFFVLEDQLNEWIKSGNKKSTRLSKWLNTWKRSWKEQPVEQLKEILQDDIVKFLFCQVDVKQLVMNKELTNNL